MNLLDEQQDDRIRAALRNANERGRLSVVAAVTGIPEKELRRIIVGCIAILTAMALGGYVIYRVLT